MNRIRTLTMGYKNEKSEVLRSETLRTRHVEYVKLMTLIQSFLAMVAPVNEEKKYSS